MVLLPFSDEIELLNPSFTLKALLREFSRAKSTGPKVYLLAATSNPQEIDYSLVRIFNEKIQVRITNSEKAKIIQNILNGLHKIKEKEFEKLALKLANFNPQNLENSMRFVAENFYKPITYKDIKKVLKKMDPSKSYSDITEQLELIELDFEQAKNIAEKICGKKFN